MNKKPMTIGGLPVPEVKTHPDTGAESSLSGMPGSAKISTARTRLINLAARMLRHDGLPSGCSEDYKFAKTTPISERRRTIKNARIAEGQFRLRAIEVKEIADLLK